MHNLLEDIKIEFCDSSCCLLIFALDCVLSRLAALNWNGEGSFLFTSSSAPYDCNDNGPCDEVLYLTLHIVLMVAFVFSYNHCFGSLH